MSKEPEEKSVNVKRLLLWPAAAGLAATLVFLGYVYLVSEQVRHRTYDIPLAEIAVPEDSASIAEGMRLVRIRGCHGCHGASLEGSVFQDDFEARFVAPNLARVAVDYSASELARAIRYGVRANGEGLWVMPSPMFYHLSDADLGRMIAALRAAPPVPDGLAYEFRPGPLMRWGMVTGDWWAIPEDVAALGPRMLEPNPGDSLRRGEYLARTACTECHGDDLRGGWGPDLSVVLAYSFDTFEYFMQSGVALGERELPVMSRVARGRFSHFTDAELRAVYTFLSARARGE